MLTEKSELAKEQPEEHYGETPWEEKWLALPAQSNVRVTYDPTIPLPGIHLGVTFACLHQEKSLKIFTAALSKITKVERTDIR